MAPPAGDTKTRILACPAAGSPWPGVLRGPSAASFHTSQPWSLDWHFVLPVGNERKSSAGQRTVVRQIKCHAKGY